MIKSLEIENFKSIKHLKLDCKRVNLFIGEPNTGKSNILETIGLLSHIYYSRGGDIQRFFRFENMTDLFYDHILENSIKILFDGKNLEINFKDGNFFGRYINEKGERTNVFQYGYQGFGGLTKHLDFSVFKFYRFAIR